MNGAFQKSEPGLPSTVPTITTTTTTTSSSHRSTRQQQLAAFDASLGTFCDSGTSLSACYLDLRRSRGSWFTRPRLADYNTTHHHPPPLSSSSPRPPTTASTVSVISPLLTHSTLSSPFKCLQITILGARSEPLLSSYRCSAQQSTSSHATSF